MTATLLAMAFALGAASTSQDDALEARRQLAAMQLAQTERSLQAAGLGDLGAAIERAAAAHADPTAAPSIAVLAGEYANALEAWQAQQLTDISGARRHASVLSSYADVRIALQSLRDIAVADEGRLLRLEAKLAERLALLRFHLNLESSSLAQAAGAARIVDVQLGATNGTHGHDVTTAWQQVLARIDHLHQFEQLIQQMRLTRHALPAVTAVGMRRALERRLAEMALAESFEILSLPDSYEQLEAFVAATHAHLAAVRPGWHALLGEDRAPRLALRRCRIWAAALQEIADDLPARCPHPALLAELRDAVSDDLDRAGACQRQAVRDIGRHADGLAQLRLNVARDVMIASDASPICSQRARAVLATSGQNETLFVSMRAACQ